MRRSADELLPRFSSADFRQEDLGAPVLDAELYPGCLLYMPARGERRRSCVRCSNCVTVWLRASGWRT